MSMSLQSTVQSFHYVPNARRGHKKYINLSVHCQIQAIIQLKLKC